MCPLNNPNIKQNQGSKSNSYVVSDLLFFVVYCPKSALTNNSSDQLFRKTIGYLQDKQEFNCYDL